MRSRMNITKALTFAAMSAYGLTAAALVDAQTSPESTSSPPAMSPAPSAEYSKLDTDRDGAVSKREARRNKELVKQWSKLDANSDGKLDEAEFAQFEATPPSSPAEPAKEAPLSNPPGM